ncbi:hypothetical protein BAE44_0009565 [Dichanthelium oligosanthes]|uniref:HNH domain-containing protein n=1 Tax=Dichanthelium oligosanthes TaxID=888268 RepID=A0A1E5VWF2_9POAL|nr:hypothetical protein BAE44_0009565 [Dichanthelium oligosanthes]
MRRRRTDRNPPPPPPPQSFGATARPTSPRSSASAAAVAADLDDLLLTAPPPSASEPRSFPFAVKQQCWEKAERVPGRDPERWRRDALGNIVFRKLVGCPGCLCHDYDHIVPYSKVTTAQPVFAVIFVHVGAKAWESNGSWTAIRLTSIRIYLVPLDGRDMDLVELSAYGNVRRGPDSGGCKIQ